MNAPGWLTRMNDRSLPPGSCGHSSPPPCSHFAYAAAAAAGRKQNRHHDVIPIVADLQVGRDNQRR